jgi:ComEC/Rec2-related protein
MNKVRAFRKLVSLKNGYPSAIFLVGIIMGQILSFMIPFMTVCLLLYRCILFIPIQWGIVGIFLPKRDLFWGALVGSLGVAIMLPSGNLGEVSSNLSYLVSVDGTPRRRAVGEIQVPVSLVGIVSKNQEGEIYIRRIENSIRYLCKGVDLPWMNLSRVRVGDTIAIKARFKKIDASKIFSFDGFLRRQGYSGTCKIKYASTTLERNEAYIDIIRRKIKETTENVLGQGEISGFPLSTSLGIKDVLSSYTEDAFRKTGLSHVLVVSGYQVTLVYGAVLAIFTAVFSRFLFLVRRFPINLVATPLALIVTGAFVLLVEPDGPVLRAWLALLVAAGAKIFEVGRNQIHNLMVGLLLMAVVSPGCYLDPGVELSFAALAGLQMGERMGKTTAGKFIWSSLAASTLTGFVSAARFGGVSITSLFINPWCAPLLSVIGCKVVIVAIGLIFLRIDPNGLVLQGTSEILLFCKELVGWFSRIEFGYFEGPVGFAISATLLTLVLLVLFRKEREIIP